MRTNRRGRTIERTEGGAPVTTLWTILVYLFVAGAIAFVGVGLWWLRPHH
jgi:hypothetical protein